MRRILSEMRFLRFLMGFSLASAMEYRASFISQIVGMMINNGIYFLFWLLFFDKFGTVKGYNISEIYLLFAIVALAFGVGSMFAGNVGTHLAALIAQGRLDYYLALPRNVLIHVVFTRMNVSAIGDMAFGLLALILAGRSHPIDLILIFSASILAAAIYVAFGVIAGSLAFYIGNSENLSAQATGALVTFALYPITLFSGASRFLLFTIVPAAFIGAVPVEIIVERNGLLLGQLTGVAMLVCAIAAIVFYTGLTHYESGSALNVNV